MYHFIYFNEQSLSLLKHGLFLWYQMIYDAFVESTEWRATDRILNDTLF